jgi:crotonobetainyl-CoA:carnitine CoA-transferase CaiB-like acyl-CoA transferase
MGPLAGLKMIELAGLGPGPMCAMLLADLGATVLRIERKNPAGLGIPRPLKYDLMFRNRKSIALDLKKPDAVSLVLRLVAGADALFEGFRPGVTERLGLGPDVCLARNPKLVYGRTTGWGQTGPLASAAGHDLNYIAVTGVLNAIGRQGETPSIPLNIIGDYAAGALYLALGLLAGILEARRSGKGQVVDAAIVDGTASLATMLFGLHAAGIHNDRRGDNILDGGAYFYDVYECADGRFISVAPIEGKFHAELLRRLDIDASAIGPHLDRANWPKGRALFAERFKLRPRDEWCKLLEGTDVCFAPVLSWAEAPNHPHLRERGTFVEVDGIVQPAPAPRFNRTPLGVPTAPKPVTPENTDAALGEWLPGSEIAALRTASTID